MEKLFETMPLAGVMGAFDDPKDPSKNWDNATVADLVHHLASVTFHTNARLDESKQAAPSADSDTTPIWGFSPSGDPAEVTQVTCRPRIDSFNKYVVLDKLEWGFASADQPTDFHHKVRVVFKGNHLDLPLSEDFWLASFITQNGHNKPGQNDIWPLTAFHDRSIVHAFVYDLDPAPSTSPDPSRQRFFPIALGNKELLDFTERCKYLDSPEATHDTRLAKDFLFADKLWDRAALPTPSATVPEDVTVQAHVVRVVVACSLTLCRQRDDFQPGDPMGVGRIYPQIMVVSTGSLDRIEAGLKFQRPKQTTILDGGQCGCTNEMLGPIGGLLVTDANKGNAMVDQPGAVATHKLAQYTQYSTYVPGAVKGPLTYLASLFNYYVVDPARESELRDVMIPLVYPVTNAAKNQEREACVGMVVRDCSDVGPVQHHLGNKFFVRKRPRQGAFDNLHLAPKMKVTLPIDFAIFSGIDGGGGGREAFHSTMEWRMDEITMAPFCAHDCFHMHWRWGDGDNDEKATWGFKDRKSNMVPGAPLVPENQGVFMVVHSPFSVSYLAHVHVPAPDEWQCICHHGAGYGLTSGWQLDNVARMAMRVLAGTDFHKMSGRDVVPVDVDDWALFYWTNRFTLNKNASGTVEVVERFSFVDRKKVLAL
jgi:hypothetical protein